MGWVEVHWPKGAGFVGRDRELAVGLAGSQQIW